MVSANDRFEYRLCVEYDSGSVEDSRTPSPSWRLAADCDMEYPAAPMATDITNVIATILPGVVAKKERMRRSRCQGPASVPERKPEAVVREPLARSAASSSIQASLYGETSSALVSGAAGPPGFVSVL